MTIPASEQEFVDKITDLYLPVDNPRDGYYYPGRLPIPDNLYPLAFGLVENAKKKRLSNSTISHSGLSFRCHIMPTPKGDWYIFRRMPNQIMSMKDAGIPSPIANALLSPRLLKGGLIIVSGLPGNGKSTTLGTIIVERLQKFGGICITIEDPVEMPLQGDHGEGLCLQRNVNSEEAFTTAIRDALRAYPAKTAAMMMIGEIRDQDAAALALRSAVDGRLVMLTMHAGDIVQSIQRLVAMASQKMSIEECRELLGSSFRLAIHQRLESKGDGTNRLKMSVLQDTLSVAGTIKQSSVKLDNLRNDLNNQQTCLRNGQPIELRPVD